MRDPERETVLSGAQARALLTATLAAVTAKAESDQRSSSSML